MSGNFILIGVIGAIRVPELPVTALRLCLYNRWTAGVGQFTEKIRILEPDQTTVMRQSEMKFDLRDVTRHSVSVSAFGQVEFKTAGTYYVEVLVDEVMKLRYPVRVVLIPPQGGAPTPPPASPPAAQSPS